MLIIFDCDGVLIDSEIISARVDCEIPGELGYEMHRRRSWRIASPASPRSGFSSWSAKELGRAIPEEIVRRAERETDRRLSAEVEPIPGVQEMLDPLDDPRCICSNSRPERLRVSLEKAGLWDRFRPYVFSARDVPNGSGKPAPDVFLHAARLLETDPAEAIVIEDSVAGVTGAVAAGMRVDRLHRRVAFLAGTWRGADGCRRDDGDPPARGLPRHCGGAARMASGSDLGERPPFVLTLEMDGESFARFNELRQAHYPPERNLVPAHVTLFHRLPGERGREIKALLRADRVRRRSASRSRSAR